MRYNNSDMFQNLIGMLGRFRKFLHCRLYYLVSKPYRYARKVHRCLFLTMYNIVSKPYRYARKFV